MRGTRPGVRVRRRSRWERGFNLNWGYAHWEEEGLLGSKGESWVGDGWFWLSEMVLVWPWKGREVGEAISAGRGVLQGVVEFGGRVERRVEGEDIRV